MTLVESRPAKARTGWAILVAFVANFVLAFVYGLLILGVIWLGQYDTSGMWVSAAWLVKYAQSPLAAFAGVIVASRMFRAANVQAAFYSFATGIVVLSIFNILLIIDHGGDGVIETLISGVLAIVGAKIASSFAEGSSR
jgi:hypothetical protein